MRSCFVVFLLLMVLVFNVHSKSITSDAIEMIKWADDQLVLDLLTGANATSLFVIDTRSSNEYNGWKSYEKFDYNSDAESVFSGHLKDAHNFEIEWLFNFNESLITQIFEERIGLMSNQSASGLNDSYEILVYDTKLERLEAMRDFLLNKFKISVLYLYKIVDKKILFETMLSQNATHFMEHEPMFDIVISPEFLYSVIFNPLAAGTRNGTLAETIDTVVTPISGYKLFDISYGSEDEHYMVSHIPTSVHLDTNELEDGPLWNRKNRTQLIDLLADLGIKENNTELVILYGNPDPMASYRVAVILKWLGVNHVHVLNGGYQAWLRRNFPIEKKFNKRVSVTKSTDYETYFNNRMDTDKANYIVDMDFVVDLVKNYHTFSDQYSLVDIRSWNEFTGETSGYLDLNATGRIPNSIWGKAGSSAIELEDYRNPDLTMRSAVDIKKMWSELGIDYENKHLILYCGSGWRAAEVQVYAEVMGLHKVSLYDGGWYEWSANVNNTVETGLPVPTTDAVETLTTQLADQAEASQTTNGNGEQDTTKNEEKNSTATLNAFSFMILLHLILAFLVVKM